MEIEVKRYSDDGDSTLGLLFINGKFECYTIEDEFRSVKISGETRIPEGRYEIKPRKVLSPLTKKYRNRFDWFEYHLELQDVPNFKYVYIHIGNDADSSDGCLLVGDSANNNNLKKGFIGESTQAFKRVYKKITKALNNNEKVNIKYEWMGSSR